jgi:hypothetical protein
MQCIYITPRALATHVARSHPNSRSKTNSNLVHQAFPLSDPAVWSSALRWLRHLQPEPFHHSGNIWRLLSTRARSEYLAILDHCLRFVASSSPSVLDERDHPSYQITSTPFWHLLLLLDPLLLRPPGASEPSSFHDTLTQRLSLYKAGRAEQLYTTPSTYPSAPAPLAPPGGGGGGAAGAPAPLAPPIFSSDTDPCPQAQTLANADNYRAVYQQITSSLPLPPMTPSVADLCQILYPPRRATNRR